MHLDTRAGPLAADAAAVRVLATRAESVDGVAPLGEQVFLALTDAESPVRHVLALRDRRDPPDESEVVRGVGDRDAANLRLAGYAGVELRDGEAVVELVVDPAARRRGLGARLLAAAQAAAGARRLHVWAHGDLPGARTLAARAGLVPGRELWRMRVELADRPTHDAPLPAAVHLRAFVPGHDEDAWVAANAAAFADHPDQGRWTVHDLRARQGEPWFDPAGLLLAERGAELLGFVWTKVHPAGDLAPARVGEIYVLGVVPEAQGLGLGRALTARALGDLAAAGLDHVVLWTSATNSRAVRTYTRAGFVPDAVDVQYTRPERG